MYIPGLVGVVLKLFNRSCDLGTLSSRANFPYLSPRMRTFMTVFPSHLYCLHESRQNARIARIRSSISAPSCHILPPIHSCLIFMKKHSHFAFLPLVSCPAPPHATSRKISITMDNGITAAALIDNVASSRPCSSRPLL